MTSKNDNAILETKLILYLFIRLAPYIYLLMIKEISVKLFNYGVPFTCKCEPIETDKPVTDCNLGIRVPTIGEIVNAIF